MNDILLDAFRHNAWATRRLLDSCGTLSEDQRDASAQGTYGSVISTLRHMLTAEAKYCSRLTGVDIAVADGESVQQLVTRAGTLASRWEQYLSGAEIDAARTMMLTWPDGTKYEVPDTVQIAQTLHHANEHRAQVSAILTSIGVEPPGLSVWDYAEATGRTRSI